jgi:hypothetical protein
MALLSQYSATSFTILQNHSRINHDAGAVDENSGWSLLSREVYQNNSENFGFLGN